MSKANPKPLAQFRRRLFRWMILSSLPLASALTGCGPSEPKEISAESSGYLPADQQSTPSKPKADTSANTSIGAVAPASSGGPSQGQASAASNLPTAPQIPSFEPGKVDPRIAAKEYMRLKLENVSDAKAIVQFMEKSTRSLRELIADSRRNMVSSDLLLERGMELSRMKLDAAEALRKLAMTDDEKAAAALGRMEALSQMANFRDVASMDQLRVVAREESENPDARVSQQAKSINLNMVTMDVDNNTAKPLDLIANVESVLKAASGLTASNLMAIDQAIAVLEKKAEQDETLQAAVLPLAKKAEESFRDHEDPQVALQAWQMHAGRTKELEEFVKFLSVRGAEAKDPAQANKLIAALMTKVPSPWTAFFLLSQAIQVEYSGQWKIAKEMIDAAEEQVKNLKNQQAREELQQNCDQFKKRTGIISKALDTSSLVDLQGNPIDLKKYEGKVVLVDFWASWCGPCIAEIPNIEKVYNELNSQGFEVIGVNLDEDPAKRDAFFQSKKLAWTTYTSKSANPDEKGFQSPISQAIGISAIPFIAIVGKDGKVADIHVRGESLKPRVTELLNAK